MVKLGTHVIETHVDGADRGVAAVPAAGWESLTSGLQLLDRADDREIVSSGWPALDRLLVGGGMRRGSLIEWLAGDDEVASGAGAATLACAAACRLAATRGPGRDGMIVVVDRVGWFHPPAVLPWLAAARLVVARPSRDDDEHWTIEQALRCAGVAAVVAWPRLNAAWSFACGAAVSPGRAGRGGLQRWTTTMRRWQLAARSGDAVGLFVRPPAAAGEPSWAESRLAVSAAVGGTLLERRLRIARVGGAWCGVEAGVDRPVEIVIDLARGRAAGAGATPQASPRRAAARPDVGITEGMSCRAS